MPVHQKLFAVLALVGAACLPMRALAADYPLKPVTIVVGFSAGGSSDALARIVAEKLAIGLGQPVVVENRAGVASIVGAAYVAKAKPDGYTLLMGASGPNVFNYALYAKLPYAPQDFTPVSLLGTFPLLLLTQANNPARSMQELVAQSKQNPDKANYGASSASFQLVTELFNNKTGARFSHIPYKGSNDAITAVISGDVTMTLVDAGAASAVLQGGRVKALAVTSAERLRELPNVPTLNELGVDLKVSFWSGLLAPAGTPAPIVKRLQEEIVRVMDMPDVKRRFNAMSVIPAASTPEEFAKLIAAETALWRQAAQDNNIKAN
ncbi:Bug family tripartite tricarboxylate transporter substrate binding protein [Polaromonas sp.]|uniref:Bug family tripartite tricarboxylate transporter substrate binding protein n=1 Tax=Polaromonas sp. TaxID=1869339 RepID=UPI003BA88520